MGGKKTMKEGLRGHLRLVERVSKAREKIICIVCIEEAEEAKEKKIAESDSAEQLWQSFQTKWWVMTLNLMAEN